MRASLDGARTSMMELLVRYGADVNAAWHGVLSSGLRSLRNA